MAVEYEISSDVATIKGVASNTQVASIVKFYTGSITYDDEPTSKYASVTINGKTQRVMLCVAVSGTVNYDDVPCLYSTVDGHRTLNVVAPTESGTPDDVPSLYETVVVDGKTVRALRCVLISATPNYDGVSSTCTFTDNGKTHTAQLVNKVVGGSIEVIIKGTSPLTLPDAIADSLSYVKAFGGTEQRNIPQPYTQVNYVTNTASTAVDTGIMIDFAKNYEFEVECRAVSGSWYILQSRASSSGNITGIHGATSGSTITLVVGNVTVCTSAITRTVGNKLYVKATLNAGTATLYVKDETANTEDTKTGSYGTSQPNPTAAVYLLGNAGGQYVDVNSDIYMARIKENDTVVMDYVPARQVATAGFYDKASGIFKTALEPANLTADGEAVPTPQQPLSIISNNGVVKVRHQSGLPLGYTLLDYIESTGTQYIDTGVKGDADYNVDITFTTPNALSNGSLFGNQRSDVLLYLSGSGLSVYNNNVSKGALTPALSANTKYSAKLSVSGTSATITGDLSGSFSDLTFPATYNIFLGANHSASGAVVDFGKFKYNSVKITKGGTLVRDFIPARRESDGVLGMYDLVNGVFYPNAGTGDFVAGNPVSDPVEIYTDGTVETINVHGKNLFDINTITEDIRYNDSGEIVTDSNVWSSDYIPVLPSTAYTYSFINEEGRLGVLRINFFDKQKNWISVAKKNFPADIASVAITETTPSNAYYIRTSQFKSVSDVQLERGSTATDYEPYYDGGTATAEMLLKVDDYQDDQSIIDGVVTRNIGILVLDGTEEWAYASIAQAYFVDDVVQALDETHTCYCSHYLGILTDETVSSGSNKIKVGSNTTSKPYWNRIYVYANIVDYPTAADFKQFLADQYTAGTPVIVLYPLATPTTESVAGQTLQVTDGDNVLEITQASLNNLELEAEYQAAVSLTIQEVQDANLDPNVEVTIN